MRMQLASNVASSKEKKYIFVVLLTCLLQVV